MKVFLKAALITAAALFVASCAETAAMLDATATQMCRENPTQECYDNGRL